MSWQLALDPSGLPVIDSPEGQDGLVRIAFKVMRITRNRQGFRTLACSGVYLGEQVDLAVTVKEDMGRGVTQDTTGTVMHPDHVYPGGVVLQRTGDSSDRLASALVDLFDLSLRTTGFEHIAPFTCTALVGDPADEHADVLFNLMTMTDEREQRAEIYLQLRPAHGLVVFREKDPVHRLPLVRYLAQVLE